MDKTRNTKQKKEIIEFLKVNSDKHLTINQIKIGLNNKIGQTTIYRIINNLISTGEVVKIPLTNKQGFCYQYKSKEENCMQHYHLICEKCGKLIHFDSKKFKDTEKEALKKEEFEINDTKIVFYGKCKKCF